MTTLLTTVLKVFTLFKQVCDGYYLLDEIFSIFLWKFIVLNPYLGESQKVLELYEICKLQDETGFHYSWRMSILFFIFFNVGSMIIVNAVESQNQISWW